MMAVARERVEERVNKSLIVFCVPRVSATDEHAWSTAKIG
jgi:hypothetical protein